MTVFGAKQKSFDDYRGFVEKFKPKKTTDDCYTPPAVYEAVKDWAVGEYGLEGREVVRPFFPGGDYEAYDYPDGCVVIDNPPFSIVSRICKDYSRWGIDFFLFAPTLTNLSTRAANHVIVNGQVTYENGAVVNTSFLTNMGDRLARTAPTLERAIAESQKRPQEAPLPKYRYPDSLLTVNDLNKICGAGIDFGVDTGIYVSALDSQKPLGKTIFGSGLLIKAGDAELKRAELKRAELKRAEQEAIIFELSARERAMISMIDKEGQNDLQA